MMKVFLNTMFICIVCFGLNGCWASKVLLPYEENPKCNIGHEFGSCGSVSDIYYENRGVER